MNGEGNGVVLGACGDFHVHQAIRVCREIQQLHPGLAVDLFTDASGMVLVGEKHDFDQLHQIGTSWFRPKIDALINSRFDKTIYLDNDVFILAPFDDIFTVLERYDVAACHDPNRAAAPANLQSGPKLPNALPQFNGGVLAIRNTQPVKEFLVQWAGQLQASGQGKDQPLLRRLLHESPLSIAVLPEEYNLLFTYSGYLRSWLQSPEKAAPRIYHHYPLRPEQPECDLLFVLGPKNYRAVQKSLARDPNIFADHIRSELKPGSTLSLWQVEVRYALFQLPADIIAATKKRLAIRTRWRRVQSKLSKSDPV